MAYLSTRIARRGYGDFRRPRRRPVAPSRRPPAPRPPSAPQIQSLISTAQSAHSPFSQPEAPYDPSAEVSAELDPMIRYTADKYNQMALDERSRLGGLTNQYVSALEGIAGQTHGLYQPSIQTLRNTSEGVAGNIRQAGEGAGYGLSSALSQAGLPANAGGSDINLGAMGAGSSDAAYALGQAMVQMLRSQQSAAEKYVGQLPGFARQEGDQRVNDALTALSKELADQIAQYTAQAPGLYRELTNEQADRERQRQQDYYSAYGTPYQHEQDAAQSAAAQASAAGAASKFGYTQARDAASTYTKNSDHVYVPKQNKDGSWRVIDVGAKTAKPGSTRKQTFKGTDGRTYILNPDGSSTPATGQSPPKPPTPTKQAAPKTGGVYYQSPDRKWHLNPKYKIVNGEPVLRTKTDKQQSGIYGTAPRRGADGVWVTGKGRRLAPAGQKYWENLYKRHIADGNGHVKRGYVAPPDSSSSASGPAGTIRKKKPQ